MKKNINNQGKDLYILGISCFFHDSSVSLLKNGEIIFAIEEEKLSRIKHDNSFPEKSIKKCLEYCNLNIDDIDYVGFYEKPFIKFENFIKNYIYVWPFGFYGFIKGIKEWLKYKLWFSSILKKKIGYDREIIYLNHHLTHSAGAYFSSSYNNSAILTIDGVGEESTTTRGTGHNNKININQELNFPHSIGLLYSTFTSYLGFSVNDGEYKMMGLAPYGEPIYKDLIFKEVVNLNNDGSFELNMKYFSFRYGKEMFNKKFEKLFGKNVRKKSEEISQFHKDIASSIQVVTEKILLKIVNFVFDKTKLDNLCISGGVGLNCVANYKILKHSKFKNIFIQPSPGDGGSSVGICYYIYYQILNKQKDKFFNNIYLGEDFSQKQILKEILNYKDVVNFEELEFSNLIKKVSSLIFNNKIIGWFQGRTEFGPRALGNRSILGNPLNEKNWKKINLKIKFRESFRPFAPSIIEENVNKFFDLDGQFPYMLFIAKTNYREALPAVVHLDNTSRVQTINETQNKKYYLLLKEFEKISSYPILINTSFNLAGEPIVNTPVDAIKTFLNCEMDYLILGDFFISKK